MRAPSLIQLYTPPLGADVLLPGYSQGRHSVEEAAGVAEAVDLCHWAAQVGTAEWAGSATGDWAAGTVAAGFASPRAGGWAEPAAGDWAAEKEC